MGMPSFSVSMLLVVLSLLNFISEAKPRPGYPFLYCPNKTTFTPNSTYQSNLHHLLSSLTSNANRESGYYNTTAGQSPGTTIYGLFLCRGDLTPEKCQKCVANATKEIIEKYCPVGKVAVIWYNECMLRYSNQSFLSTMDDIPIIYQHHPQDMPDRFTQLLGTTLNDTISRALNAPSGAKKFATKEANYTDLQTLYTLVQCIPVLLSSDCNICLRGLKAFLQVRCNGKQGAVGMNSSCSIRYEIYPFYQLQVDPSRAPLLAPPAPAPSSLPLPRVSPIKGNERKKIPTAIIIVVPSVIALMLTISICIFLRVRKPTDNFETVDEIKSVESLQFDFSSIRAATTNFSDTNILGKGGFGVVYKGKLSNGQEMAVKRLSRNSQQGDLEFKNEVLLVAKLQHRNLVRLLGFCLEGKERLLIYEFVPNRSLNYYIFDPMERAHINWEMRYKIIRGIARGILYLHEDSRLRIIHRDLKASNILLDAEMNPKISDFGMARMFVLDQTEGSTNRIVGTYGYMAPEYAMLGQFSIKSDVFSFGVIILEVVSGQKITCFHDGEKTENLLSYAWKNWREETTSNLLDPTLRDGPITEMTRCIKIGLLCVQENVSDRPSMTSVVHMLNGNLDLIPTPTQPASFMRCNVVSSTSVQHDNGSRVTNNEASMTELCPR